MAPRRPSGQEPSRRSKRLQEGASDSEAESDNNTPSVDPPVKPPPKSKSQGKKTTAQPAKTHKEVAPKTTGSKKDVGVTIEQPEDVIGLEDHARKSSKNLTIILEEPKGLLEDDIDEFFQDSAETNITAPVSPVDASHFTPSPTPPCDTDWESTTAAPPAIDLDLEDIGKKLVAIKENHKARAARLQPPVFEPVDHSILNEATTTTAPVPKPEPAPIAKPATVTTKRAKPGRPRKEESLAPVVIQPALELARPQVSVPAFKLPKAGSEDGDFSDDTGDDFKFTPSQRFEFKLILPKELPMGAGLRIPGECDAGDWGKTYSDILGCFSHATGIPHLGVRPSVTVALATEKGPGDLILNQEGWKKVADKVLEREKQMYEHTGAINRKPKALTPLIFTLHDTTRQLWGGDGNVAGKNGKKTPLARMVYPNSGPMGFGGMAGVETQPFALAQGQQNEPAFAVAGPINRRFLSLEEARMLITQKHNCQQHHPRLCWVVTPNESAQLAGQHIAIRGGAAGNYAKAIASLASWTVESMVPEGIRNILLESHRQLGGENAAQASNGQHPTTNAMTNSTQPSQPGSGGQMLSRPLAQRPGTAGANLSLPVDPLLNIPLESYPPIIDVLDAMDRSDTQNRQYAQTYTEALMKGGAFTIGELLMQIRATTPDLHLAAAITQVARDGGLETVPAFIAGMMSIAFRNQACKAEAQFEGSFGGGDSY